MATATTKLQPRIGRVDDDEEQHGQLVDCFCDGMAAARMREASKRPVSRLAVEGGGGNNNAGHNNQDTATDHAAHARRSSGGAERTLPPPHAWLAIDDIAKKKQHHHDGSSSDHDEQWLRLLRNNNNNGGGGHHHQNHHQHGQHRRSSFSVVRRERLAREAWLDRAWEMKRSWHQRNGGAPDADTPVVVVVGNSEHSSSHSQHHHDGGGCGGGVAMDVEEVRACRDLGLELPSDCTVEVQCYGISGDSSPTHTAGSSGSGADSPCAGVSSPAGADPMDVKARLKVWAQAVALASTTQLGS